MDNSAFQQTGALNADISRPAEGSQPTRGGLLDAIGDAIVTLDRDFRIIYVNAEAARINKKPTEAFLGRLHWEEWPASVGTAFEREFRRAMTERTSVSFRERYAVAGEYDDWIDCAAYPAADADGGGLHLVYRDVTAQVRREEALRASEEKLRDARARLESILFAGDIGTWDWDLVSDTLVGDAGVVRLFGVAPEEAASGQVEVYLRAMHPDDRPVVRAAIEEAVARGDSYTPEYRVVLPDGAVRHLAARGRVERDSDGRAISLPGVVVDISERVRREQREKFLDDLAVRVRGLLDPDAVLYETARAVGEYTNADRCLYIEVVDGGETITIRRDYVRDESIASFAGTYSPDAFGAPIVAGLRAATITQSEDTETNERLAENNRAQYRASNVRSFLAAPLHRAGEWVATLALHQTTPRRWTAAEGELLPAVMERTWLAVENARLFRETRRRAEREALLNRIGAAVRDATGTETILAAAVRELGTGLSADRCYVVRYDEARDTARISPEWTREGAGEPFAGRTFTMSAYSMNRDPVFRAGSTQVVDDVIAHSPDDAERLLALPIRALMRIPIKAGEQMTTISVTMAREPRRWTDGEVRLVQNVATLLHSALESARALERERNIARQLQAALVPENPPPMPGLALASYYRPALEEAGVGGDFFDVFETTPGCTALVVADVSGKGLAAAQQVATIRNMLRFALYGGGTLASAITNLHNALVTHDLLTGFATLFVGVYDHAARTLTYVNCGQEPGLVFRRGSGVMDALISTGSLLGGFEVAGGFDQNTVSLAPGDVLALFTDGLTEVGPSRKDMLEVDGVSELFRECCAQTPPSSPRQIVDGLIAGVDGFARGGARDDIALLVAVVEP